MDISQKVRQYINLYLASETMKQKLLDLFVEHMIVKLRLPNRGNTNI